MWEEGPDEVMGEKKGGKRRRCTLMWLWTVLRLRFWPNMYIKKKEKSPRILLSPSVPPSPRRSEGERDRSGVGWACEGPLCPFCPPAASPPVCPSVRPSQASSASIGSQLDDPLAAAVAVVQVQEVRVWIQAVLT